jgi:hypothetical protein
MLREAGIPARARAGFAGYVTDGFSDDHWAETVHQDEWGLTPPPKTNWSPPTSPRSMTL